VRLVVRNMIIINLRRLMSGCFVGTPETVEKNQISPRSLNTSTASRTQPLDAGKPQ
jgi:hypothetical protein